MRTMEPTCKPQRGFDIKFSLHFLCTISRLLFRLAPVPETFALDGFLGGSLRVKVTMFSLSGNKLRLLELG